MNNTFISRQDKASLTLSLQISEWGIAIQGEENSVNIPWISTAADINTRLLAIGIQKSQLHRIQIEVINRQFLMIPTTYDSTVYRVGYLEKAFGEDVLVGQEIESQTCEFAESILYFLIPSTWKDKIAKLFPVAHCTYSHIIANELSRTKAFIHPRLKVFVYPQFSLVYLIKHGKLQMANAFPFQSPEELAFYLHSIREAFDVNPWNMETIQIINKWPGEKSLYKRLKELNIPIEFETTI